MHRVGVTVDAVNCQYFRAIAIGVSAVSYGRRRGLHTAGGDSDGVTIVRPGGTRGHVQCAGGGLHTG